MFRSTFKSRRFVFQVIYARLLLLFKKKSSIFEKFINVSTLQILLNFFRIITSALTDNDDRIQLSK